MIKSRIVAIALIGIILSSSISVVDGYTVTINVKEINEKFPIIDSHQYNIMLYDAVVVKLVDSNYFNTNSYKINLLDGIGIKFSDDGYPVDPGIYAPSNTISVEIIDGLDTKSEHHDTNNDIKIIKIKQDHDKKALWERIFPLERIKNTIKSLYREIQNDHILSYVQLSEVYSDDEQIEQFSVLGFEFEQIDKFIGKANYVGDQLGIQWQHLTDVDKFIGKANYVGIQLAGHAQQLTDPEKFVKKSNFVGKQLTISVYRVVDPNQPTLLVLLIPLASFVLIRSEHENIQFYHIQRFVSIVFIFILVSSVVISPYYLATLYWGYAFAQEPEDIGPPAVPPPGEIQQQPIEEISVPPPVDELPAETPVQPPAEAPVQQSINYSDSFDESFILLENITLDLQQIIPELINYNHTILFNETINLFDDETIDLQSILLQNKTIQLSWSYIF